MQFFDRDCGDCNGKRFPCQQFKTYAAFWAANAPSAKSWGCGHFLAWSSAYAVQAMQFYKLCNFTMWEMRAGLMRRCALEICVWRRQERRTSLCINKIVLVFQKLDFSKKSNFWPVLMYKSATKGVPPVQRKSLRNKLVAKPVRSRRPDRFKSTSYF